MGLQDSRRQQTNTSEAIYHNQRIDKKNKLILTNNLIGNLENIAKTTRRRKSRNEI